MSGWTHLLNPVECKYTVRLRHLYMYLHIFWSTSIDNTCFLIQSTSLLYISFLTLVNSKSASWKLEKNIKTPIHLFILDTFSTQITYLNTCVLKWPDFQAEIIIDSIVECLHDLCSFVYILYCLMFKLRETFWIWIWISDLGWNYRVVSVVI